MVVIHDERAGVKPWLYTQRPTLVFNGIAITGFPPRILIVHASRGGNRTRGPLNTWRGEYNAVINWLKTPNNNQGGWGSATNFVIDGPDVAVLIDPRFMPTYSCGYGARGRNTWPVDFCGISIEVCQPGRDDEFPALTIDTLVEFIAQLCREYPIAGVHFLLGDQSIWPPPSGLTGHDETENGKVYGKSDPGYQFPWQSVMQRVNALLQPAPAPTPPPEEDDMPKYNTGVRDFVIKPGETRRFRLEPPVHPDIKRRGDHWFSLEAAHAAVIGVRHVDHNGVVGLETTYSLDATGPRSQIGFSVGAGTASIRSLEFRHVSGGVEVNIADRWGEWID